MWLYTTPRSHVTDLTRIDGTSGTVDYTVEASAADGVEVAIVLRDADEREVVTGTGAAGTLPFPTCTRGVPATATSTTSRCGSSTATTSSAATT